ncbi:MAG: NAD(P)/FAD-dependent oxidoreductase [Burkholderiales bacterium]|jgi:predicted Rossmann fold flavoprotein
MQRYDALVVGAGAAGLFCAGVAAQRGLAVALVDHAPRLAEKIRISGGGRCNFTNLEADRPERFLSEDPRFARTALRAYGPRRFVKLVESYRVGWHEKHRGQLFCDDSSERIIELLRAECDRGGVAWYRPCAVREVRVADAAGEPRERFVLDTDAGPLAARALVVATGGPPIPKIGATDWGHRLAARLGLQVIEPRPALVPLTFTAQSWQPFAALAGLALEVGVSLPGVPGATRFDEDLLFTHRGLSGPAILQISSFWRPGEPLAIDLAPGLRIADALLAAREGTRQQLGTALAGIVPRRLAQAWLEDASAGGPPPERRLAELGNKALAALAARFHDWRVLPAGTEGWRKAEVSAGGVATAELDPRTLEAHRVPGLHFIGEVVDVTGWLGGYNFQWAWASGFAAAQALATARPG